MILDLTTTFVNKAFWVGISYLAPAFVRRILVKDLGKVELHKFQEDCDWVKFLLLELDQYLALKGASVATLLFVGRSISLMLRLLEFGSILVSKQTLMFPRATPFLEYNCSLPRIELFPHNGVFRLPRMASISELMGLRNLYFEAYLYNSYDCVDWCGKEKTCRVR